MTASQTVGRARGCIYLVVFFFEKGENVFFSIAGVVLVGGMNIKEITVLVTKIKLPLQCRCVNACC